MSRMKILSLSCLLASVSAPALSQETNASTQLNNIVTSSQVIRDKFDYALKGVYGMEDLSHMGKSIPTTGILDPAKLTWDEAQTYNMSLEEYRYMYIQSALGEYIDTQTMNADMDMHTAVDNFVNASTAVLQVVKVNEMAAQAETSGDVESAQNVQTYIQNNDVSLSETEVSDFNQSLDDVATTAQTYAALQAVAVSDLKSELETAAAEMGADANNATELFFDNVNNTVGIKFTQEQNGAIVLASATVDVSAFMSIDNAEFFDAGATNPFYTNGPTQQNAGCLLNTSDLVSCTGRGGSMGPPPNTLLYNDYNNDGVMVPVAYTDANGNVIEYVAGDEVYNPETNEYVGYWDNNFNFVCESASYCTI